MLPPSKKTKPRPVPSHPEHSTLFELLCPTASEVFLVGSFNRWSTTSTPMIPIGNGRWVKELQLLPGRYEYRFLADGRWLTDPRARETAPNPYGERNAVVNVREQTSPARRS